MCLELLYQAPNDTPVNCWIAQLRSGKWIDGKSFPLASNTALKDGEMKILLQFPDLSKFRFLPGDELRLYTWCDDPEAKIKVRRLELSTE